MEDNQENKIDLMKYFDRFYKAFMKLRMLVFIIVIACMAFFEIKTVFFFHTVYSSQAVFIASSEGQDNIYMTSDDNDDLLSTFNGLITGNMMQKVIMKDLGVSSVPGNISLSRIPDTNLIELKVTSSNAQDAYDVITCIINNYGQVTDLVMSDVSMSILDTPMLASEPDAYPDYLGSAIKGLLVGLIISFFVTLLYAIFRNTINSKDDVKNILHLNSLTKIPYLTNGQKKYSKISHLLLSNPRIQYAFKSSFHDLRLKIEQEHKNKDTKVIMVTSTLPNEGKSMTSVNVAISLADKGYHVVLVDMDLRNPSIFNTMKESHLSGNIVDYLKGHYSLDEVINQYQDYSMDVIYGVDSYPDATELLSKVSFNQLINKLKDKYDFVILDVPPLYMMEDALLIANESDSAIVVIKQDFANAYDILDSLEELNEHVPYIMGAVLNQVKPSFFDQEQGSRYGYGHYGYGYGYGYGKK